MVSGNRRALSRAPSTPLPHSSPVSALPFTTYHLPVLVLRPVERLAVRLREDVVDVLPAPRRRVRLVLVRAHTPLGRVRHRVDRDLAEELQLPSARVVRHRHA